MSLLCAMRNGLLRMSGQLNRFLCVLALAGVSHSAIAAELTYSGEITESNGAFSALLPIGSLATGPVIVEDAALAAGSIGVADIIQIEVNVGNFCFATGVLTCGDVGQLVPIESIDSAAITGTSGTLAGNFAVTAFSPTFNISIPIVFDLDAGTIAADGGALGTVLGTGSLTAPEVVEPMEPMISAFFSGPPSAIVGGAPTVGTVFVENTGDAPLNIMSIAGLAAPFSVNTAGDGDGCSAMQLAPMGMCTISIAFTPTAAGAAMGTVTINSNDPTNSALDVPLSATGIAPVIGVAPDPITFMDTTVNETDTVTITITNTGDADLNVTSLSITGGAPFSIPAGMEMCTIDPVNPGTDCTFDVEFAPTMEGMFMDSVVIESNDVAAGPVTVPLSGVATPIPAPIIMVAPDPVMFMDTMVTETDTVTVTITNTGDAELDVMSLTVTGGAPFSIPAAADMCTGTMVAITNGTCTFDVEFAPTAEGDFTDTIVIMSNDAAANPLSLTLNGTGTMQLLPSIMVAPTTLDFGELLFGEMDTQDVTVTNTGTAPLTITAVTAPAPNFSSTDDCVGTLAVAAMCTISVTFAPTEAGDFMLALDIASDDPDAAVTQVMLTATGVEPMPEISADMTSVTMPQATVGATSMATVTISNNGTADLNVTSVTVTGPEITQTNACGVLAPMATCTVDLTFTPAAAGDVMDALVITSDDPANMMLSIPVTATAVLAPEPNIIADVMMLDFGEALFGAMVSQVVELSNNGTAELTINGINIVGVDAANFGSSTTCGATLAVGASCMVTVNFSPMMPAGAKTANLSVMSDDPDLAELLVALSGTALMPVPNAMVTPAAIDFGEVAVGETADAMFTVTNMGEGELVVSDIAMTDALAAPFSLMGETCTAGALAMGETCTITVTYAPTMMGSFMDTLNFTSNDAMAVTELMVSGTAIELLPSAQIAPASAAFGDVIIGQSAEAMFTVTNTGPGDLIVSAIADTDGLAAPFSLVSETCTAGAVAMDGMCTITVAFAPTMMGDFSDMFNITSNDAMAAMTLAVAGAGVPMPAPEIEVMPLMLDLGSVVANDSTTGTVTVTNTGNADLMVSMVSLSGADAALFSQVNDCMSVAAGAMCTVTVTFAPDAAGTFAAELNIASDDADEPMVVVALSGMATPEPMPMIDVAASADAGMVTVGESADTEIVVTNNGTADLIINSIMIGDTALGMNSADYMQTNDCMTVAPAGTCTITLTFTPAAVGASIAGLTISSNDAASAMSLVTLSGTGLAPLTPAAMFSATALDFGTVRIEESAMQTVTISNAGTADLMVTGAALSGANAGDYALDNGCGTVEPDADCTITVTYSPTAEGASAATLTVTSDDAMAMSTDIALSATGAPMEEVVVTVTSSGDSSTGAFGWLELMVLSLFAMLVRNATRVRRTLAIVVVALSTAFAPATLAQESAGDDGYWYVTAGFGSSDGQADVGEISRNITSAGATVSSIAIDDSDSGYAVNFGYQATPRLGIEFGYVELGDADIDLSLAGLNVAGVQAISRTLSENLALLGSGYSGTVVLRQPIRDRFAIFARVGLTAWDSSAGIAAGTSSTNITRTESESGTDFHFGVGAEGWFGAERKIGVRGAWQRYEFGPNENEFLSLSAMYRF